MAQSEPYNTLYDTIIIGGGPSALAASIYAARQKIKFLVLAKDIGGQVALSSDVENYLGVPGMKGLELSQLFRKHAEKNNVPIKYGIVESISREGSIFRVKTASSQYSAKTILIASGKKPRKLNIPGEKEFYGKGVTYCATCDAPLFKDVPVAVIGGGNSAMDAALLASNYASKVYLININDKLSGETALMTKVLNNTKITVHNSSITKEFRGDKFLNSLLLEKKGAPLEIEIKAAFIEIGYIPAVDFDNLTKKNRWNEIIIHEENFMSNLTSVPGIFAAGDCTSVPEKQVIVAAGEGAKAILSIFKYLQNKRKV